MADALDTMLEPGEGVIWRDPRGWVPSYWPSLLAILLLISTWWAWRGDGFDLERWFFGFLFWLVVVALGSVPGWLLDPMGERSAASVLTDRRVLNRLKTRKPADVGIALGDIQAVAILRSQLVVITGRDGSKTSLAFVRAPQRFAAAVATAAGLPQPVAVAPLLRLEERAPFIGGAVCFFLAYGLFYGALGLDERSSALADIAQRVTSEFFLLLASIWLGGHLACVLGLVVLRPRVGAEAVRVWLHRRSEDKFGRRLLRWTLWKSRPYVRLAELLWGEPMDDPKEGANAHG